MTILAGIWKGANVSFDASLNHSTLYWLFIFLIKDDVLIWTAESLFNAAEFKSKTGKVSNIKQIQRPTTILIEDIVKEIWSSAAPKAKRKQLSASKSSKWLQTIICKTTVVFPKASYVLTLSYNIGQTQDEKEAHLEYSHLISA